jgi:AraC-like DNA-binding protein
VTELRPSDLVVYDTTRPYEFRFPGHNRLLVVGIPRRMLGVPRGLTSSITARRLTTTGGASRVVASFLRTVHAELDALSGGANEQRLAALLVRRDLASPELAGVSVARLATRDGLSDAPHFSRLFRATYGCTPGDYRATALSAGSSLPRTGTPS